MPIFKATIDVYVDVDSEPEACDAIAETLSDHLRKYTPESCWIDWSYRPDGFPKPSNDWLSEE